MKYTFFYKKFIINTLLLGQYINNIVEIIKEKNYVRIEMRIMENK